MDRFLAGASWLPFFAPDPPAGGGAGDPPAGDPPAGDPPAGDPPAGDPPAGDPGSRETTEGDEAVELNGAPEGDYEQFAVPEGLEINGKTLEGFQALAKELDLSQAGAQRLVDLDVARAQASAEQQAADWQKAIAKWLVDAKADKEVGGDKFDANVEVAKRAINKFGTPELVAALNELGIGNHPEFIRFTYRIGQTISEADVVPGQSRSASRSLAERLYPSMQSG